MNDFPFDIVGFDLDGTLVDSLGDLANAVNHALAEAGRLALDRDRIRSMIGNGVRRLLERALAATGGGSEADVDCLQRDMLEHYRAHIAIETRPYSGVIDTLDALAARGVTLAIATNKVETLAETLLDELGMRARFACVIGGDTMGDDLKKPDRAPLDEMIRRCGGGRAAFVGDSITDMKAARNAGLPSVLVSFGFRNETVEELAPDAVIDSFAELIPALERMGNA